MQTRLSALKLKTACDRLSFLSQVFTQDVDPTNLSRVESSLQALKQALDQFTGSLILAMDEEKTREDTAQALAFFNAKKLCCEFFLGSDQPNDLAILHNILILTDKNENEFISLVISLLNNQSGDPATRQLFAIKAATALLYLIRPNLEDAKEKAKNVNRIAIEKPLFDEKKSTKNDSEKKIALPEVDSFISEKILLPFLQKANSLPLEQARSSPGFSVLESAFHLYQMSQLSKAPSEHPCRKAYESFLIKFFMSYATPHLHFKILRKGVNISIHDEETANIGHALLEAGRLKDSNLFSRMLQALDLETSAVNSEIVKYKVSTISWLGLPFKNKNNKIVTDLRLFRTRKIVKILMLPLLKELKPISNTKKALPTPPLTHEESLYQAEHDHIGQDLDEVIIYQNPELAFLKDIRAKAHQSLYLQDYPQVLAAVKCLTTIADIYKASGDPNFSHEKFDTLCEEATERYKLLYPAAERDKIYFKKAIAKFAIWAISTIIITALIGACMWFFPVGIALGTIVVTAFLAGATTGAIIAKKSEGYLERNQTFEAAPLQAAHRLFNHKKSEMEGLNHDRRYPRQEKRKFCASICSFFTTALGGIVDAYAPPIHNNSSFSNRPSSS